MASSSATVPEAASAALLAAKASYFSAVPRRTMLGTGQVATAAATRSATIAVVGTTMERPGWRAASRSTVSRKIGKRRATSPPRLPGSTLSKVASGARP